MTESTILILAYTLDLVIGDPKQLPHPVKIMGWTITKLEDFLRNRAHSTHYRIKNKERREKATGVVLVVIIVGFTYGLFYVINSLFTVYRSLFAGLLMVYLISTTLATRGLVESADSVIKTLNIGSIEEARKRLSCIVGRDTKTLDRNGILKATIESLAENASDGIIAPLFYFSIGGLPLAMTYKAINTMDSMVGYKNERYRHFGWAAARLDDIANYIPARMTGFLIVVSSAIVSRSVFSVHCSLKTMLRDGRKHLSPNSGVPEAAMAGALGMKLGGPSTYKGTFVEKPYIGEEIQNTELMTQNSDKNDFHLKSAEKAIILTKFTSLIGFGVALTILYLRAVL